MKQKLSLTMEPATPQQMAEMAYSQRLVILAVFEEKNSSLDTLTQLQDRTLQVKVLARVLSQHLQRGPWQFT